MEKFFKAYKNRVRNLEVKKQEKAGRALSTLALRASADLPGGSWKNGAETQKDGQNQKYTQTSFPVPS